MAQAFHLHGQITDRQVGDEPMTYGGHRLAHNVLVDNANPDQYQGEPSAVTNQVSLPDGWQLNRLTLELQIGEIPPLEREPAFRELIPRDFFGVERQADATAAGPFATTPPEETSLHLWRGRVAR